MLATAMRCSSGSQPPGFFFKALRTSYNCTYFTRLSGELHGNLSQVPNHHCINDDQCEDCGSQAEMRIADYRVQIRRNGYHSETYLSKETDKTRSRE